MESPSQPITSGASHRPANVTAHRIAIVSSESELHRDLTICVEISEKCASATGEEIYITRASYCISSYDIGRDWPHRITQYMFPSGTLTQTFGSGFETKPQSNPSSISNNAHTSDPNQDWTWRGNGDQRCDCEVCQQDESYAKRLMVVVDKAAFAADVESIGATESIADWYSALGDWECEIQNKAIRR